MASNYGHLMSTQWVVLDKVTPAIVFTDEVVLQCVKILF